MKQSSLPFSSIFADEMRQYLELAESADKVTESYYYTFKRLDDFIVKQNYQEKILSADIQYAWINTLDTSSRSRAGEASRLRQFARYLNALGIPAIEIESVRVSSDYVAHNFTDDEIARIIDAADNLISHMNVFVVKEYFPLILRILIGCGMRITEVLRAALDRYQSRYRSYHGCKCQKQTTTFCAYASVFNRYAKVVSKADSPI